MSGIQLVLDHLWQSTVVAGAIALVAALLHGKRAGVRYALWFAASMKFAIPFSALTAIGAAIGSRTPLRVPQPTPEFLSGFTTAPFVAETVAVPASAVATAASSWSSTVFGPGLIAGIWAAGCAVAFAVWAVRWRRARAAVRSATPLDTGREVDILRRLEASFGRRRPMAIRASDATIEPGVLGVFRPVLLWPRSMSEHLSDDQIETILIHELSHVRRRDNLTAIVHMLVEALCWFHPLVWWVGMKLVDERERACDEDVVRMGRDRQVYAESLLKTCQFCVGAPVTCMAGVTGSDLKRRVTAIMAAPVGTRLSVVARIALVAAAVVVVAIPVVGGAASAPQLTGTGLSLPDPSRTFEAASVRQNKSGERGSSGQTGSGHVTMRNMAIRGLLVQSLALQDSQLIGGPDWLATDRFDIVAKAEGTPPDADLKPMLQNLLIERFALKMHIETRTLPIYALVLARADGKLGPDLQVAQCESDTTGQGCGPGAGPGAARGASGGTSSGGGGVGVMSVGAGRSPGAGSTMASTGITMQNLARMLSGTVGRTIVDRTGLAGRFDMKLRYSRQGASTLDGDPSQNAPELFTAIQEQLGLKLEATRGPVEVLVIDSAQHPVNDDFVMPDPAAGPPVAPPVR